jgi:hypothetical protein
MGAETLMGPALFREYFDCSVMVPSGETEEPSGGETEEISSETEDSSGSFVGQLEVKHAIALTSFEGTMLWDIPENAKRRPLKESDANWLFFFIFAHHCGSLSSNIASDATPKITVKL